MVNIVFCSATIFIQFCFHGQEISESWHMNRRKMLNQTKNRYKVYKNLLIDKIQSFILQSASCCSIFSFLCSVLQFIICPSLLSFCPFCCLSFFKLSLLITPLWYHQTFLWLYIQDYFQFSVLCFVDNCLFFFLCKLYCISLINLRLMITHFVFSNFFLCIWTGKH